MIDFEEYIRQGEPQQREKGYGWQTAIGLQAVDGLKTSEYLLKTAQKHIEGDIKIEEAKQSKALVRANYTDVKRRVFATMEYVELFFRNLLIGEANELKNRNLLINIADNEGEVSEKCRRKGRELWS